MNTISTWNELQYYFMGEDVAAVMIVGAWRVGAVNIEEHYGCDARLREAQLGRSTLVTFISGEETRTADQRHRTFKSSAARDELTCWRVTLDIWTFLLT
jgi:hypothetical protein